jgi:ribosome-binding factor A
MKDRILRLNEVIKENLGRIILQEVEFPNKAIVTITRVATANDYKSANIFISVIGNKEEIAQVYETLKINIGSIQHNLNKRMNINNVPRISFKKEEFAKEANKIEELLEKLKEK